MFGLDSRASWAQNRNSLAGSRLSRPQQKRRDMDQRQNPTRRPPGAQAHYLVSIAGFARAFPLSTTCNLFLVHAQPYRRCFTSYMTVKQATGRAELLHLRIGEHFNTGVLKHGLLTCCLGCLLRNPENLNHNLDSRPAQAGVCGALLRLGEPATRADCSP